MADLYHPVLGVYITVPDGAAWVRFRNGWEYAAEPPAVEHAPVELAPDDGLLRHDDDYNKEDQWDE